jgi:hypothetical protein
MMANTLYENISIEDKIEAKYYYICETSYYINKCIDEFGKMQNLSAQIFKNTNTRIAPQRLLLVIKLIIKLRHEIKTKIDGLNASNEKKISDYIDEANKKHNEKLNQFIAYIVNNVEDGEEIFKSLEI